MTRPDQGPSGRRETLGTRLEFLSGSDKVNPKFVKETRVKPKESLMKSDSGNSDDLAAAHPTTAAVGEMPNDANDSPCPPKKKIKEVKSCRQSGRKHHLKLDGGPTSSYRESRQERRANVRGFVKLPK